MSRDRHAIDAGHARPVAATAAVFRLSLLVQGGALRAPRGAVSDAAASARAGRAASGRSPRGARLHRHADFPPKPTSKFLNPMVVKVLLARTAAASDSI